MRVTTKATWDSIDDFIAGLPPRDAASFEWRGPVMLLKKGREAQQKVTQSQQDLAKTYQGVQTGAREQADPFAKSLMATAPGELSPYAQGQYAGQVRNINDTYGNNTRSGFKTLAYRGMGGPTGETASIINTANRQRDLDMTNAYNTALQNTYGQGLQGLNYFAGQQQLYDPNNPLSGASNSAYRQSQMGSTMGDIGAGLTTASNAALSGAAIACWIAEKIYGTDDRRTHLLRHWLNNVWGTESWIGRLTMFAYQHTGRAVAALRPVVTLLRPLFAVGLRRAEAWRFENATLGGF